MNYIWDQVWAGKKYQNPRSRREKVSYKIELFRELGGDLRRLGVVADVGCGAGYFAKRLRSVMSGNVIALDKSPVAIEKAKRLNSDQGIDYHLGDAVLPWPIRERLDGVFLIGVIEHITEGEAVLKNAYDSLKPGGELFICSSSKLSVFHLEKWFLERLKRWRLGYQKDYETNELIQLLTSHGFNIKRHYVAGCIRRRSLLSRLDRFLSRTMGWGRYIFLIAERT
jgi:SAM-dependent methyltransferase